jgi:hypothetical protein
MRSVFQYGTARKSLVGSTVAHSHVIDITVGQSPYRPSLSYSNDNRMVAEERIWSL